MRIALTVDPELPVPPKSYGGIERIVDMLAGRLMARGHSVTLFANGDSKCPATLVPWPGRASQSALDTARNAALLLRHALAGRYDLVHSFPRLAYLAPFISLNIPKLMSHHREISPRTTALGHRLSRGTLEFSAISRHMMQGRAEIGRWHLAPNGAPLDTYDFRRELSPDAPLVFLGRIGEIDRGACRKRVENLFSDDAMVDGYFAIYRKMLEPTGGVRDQR